MDIIAYIKAENYVLIPILWTLGKIIKDTPLIPNWGIPWILLALSIVGMGLKESFSFESIFQAILLCSAAVFGNQLFKQTMQCLKEGTN